MLIAMVRTLPALCVPSTGSMSTAGAQRGVGPVRTSDGTQQLARWEGASPEFQTKRSFLQDLLGVREGEASPAFVRLFALPGDLKFSSLYPTNSWACHNCFESMDQFEKRKSCFVCLFLTILDFPCLQYCLYLPFYLGLNYTLRLFGNCLLN